MPVRKPHDKVNRLDGNTTIEDVNPHIRIDGLEKTEGEPLVAKPIPLSRIYADPRQPRRAVPPAMRGEWDGSPEGVPAMLETWRKQTTQRIQKTLDVASLIIKRDERILEDVDTKDPIALGYISLIRLAASIHHEGLTNPPTVSRDGQFYRLTAGERRTLAYHLLLLTTGNDRYNAIPVFKSEHHDIWKQASENNAREELNAIGLARQIALLLIELYKEVDGVDFQDYHQLVVPGGSDRAYYAQVANGNVYRIPRGEGQRVQDAMGVSSRRMLSAYRALLSIPDRLWILADNLNYTENRIREATSAISEAQWRGVEELSDTDLDAYIEDAIARWKSEKNTPAASNRPAAMLPTGNIATSGTLSETPQNRPTTGEIDRAAFGNTPTSQRPPLPAGTRLYKPGNPTEPKETETEEATNPTPPPATNRRPVLRNGEIIHIPVSQLQQGDQIIDDPDDLPLQPGDRVEIDNRAGVITQVSPEAARIEFDDMTVLNLPSHQWDIIRFLPSEPETKSPDEPNGELDQTPIIMDDDALLMLWASEPLMRGIPDDKRLQFNQLRQWLLDVSPEEIRRSIQDEGMSSDVFNNHVEEWVETLHNVLDRWTSSLSDEIDRVIHMYAEIEQANK